MKIKNILGNSFLIVIPFLCIELIFQILPVSYPPYIMPVSSDNPVAHYQPNKHFVYSKGWNFSIQAKKFSNNYGYINQTNYDMNDHRPLMMTIGDSFVEANQVDAGTTAAELLHSEVNPEGRVYSIGLSGAPLSQYLIFAEYSRNTFQPRSMTFIIINNDFDESLQKYNSFDMSEIFHLFIEEGDSLSFDSVDYQLSQTKQFLRQSAFVRYLMLNLEAKASLEAFAQNASVQPTQYTSNVSGEIIHDSKKVVDEFFNQLPVRSGLDANEILFVIDGMRPALYSQEELEKEKNSYFSQMQQYFVAKALALGYEVIDMQPAFIKKNRLDGSRFEFKNDGHWNELGHLLVAEEIKKSTVFNATFKRDAN